MRKITAKAILINRNFLILLIATIGILPELMSLGGYFIRGDITAQMLPFVYETKRMFASGAPFWSWNTYFGDNFIASYAYYTVFNPFTWINCLFPYKYLGLGFTLVLYLKFLVCGWVSQAYLKKIGFDIQLSLIGCILYTFSSWAISNLYYYMFMEPMILFPLLLIFVERFLRKERHAYSGLAMAVFVVVAVNYYFAAVNLMAGTLYFFCRLFNMTSRKASEDAQSSDWCEILKAVGCVLLGIMSASVVLIPVLMHLYGSPHQTFYFEYLGINSVADRICWLFYPKTMEEDPNYLFIQWGCYSHAAWIAVFGILPTLLLFTKKGYGWIKWLTGMMLVIYITPLNGVFSLFTECDYSRWAYALTLAIIICTLNYIRDFGMPRMSSAVWYCVVVYGAYCLFVSASAYWHYKTGGDRALSVFVKLGMDAVLVAINAMALLLLCVKRQGGRVRYTTALVAVTICVSVQFFMFTFHGVKEYSPKHFLMTEREYFIYGDDLRKDGDFGYRTNFNLLRNGGWTTNNFGLISNRPSIETFHSVQNTKMQKWNNIVSDSKRRVFRPLNFVESFEALMSVKELSLPSNEYRDTCISGITIGRDGHFTIYESDHYIPMGFTYDSYVLSDSIESLAMHNEGIDIPMILLSALAIDKADEKELSPYLKKSRIYGNVRLDSLVAARKALTCNSFKGHSQGFNAHIQLDSASVVFFSVLADNGFKAYIDGKPTKIYDTNLGFSSIIVPEGSHDITFKYFPPGLLYGLIISMFGWIIMLSMYYKSL